MRTLLGVILSILCLPLVAFGDNLFNQGVEALQAQNYVQAVAIFSQTIGEHPGASYGNRCIAYLLLGEYQKAELDCTRSLDYLPQNPELWLNRGLSWHRLGKPERAIADFNIGIELDSQNYRLFYDRALAYSELLQPDRALADYNRALELVPLEERETRAELLTDRGIELMLNEELAAALRDFDRGIDLAPQNTRIWFHRGCAHHRLAQLDQALVDFDQVLLLEPHNPEAYRGRGLVQKQQGKTIQALADLDRAQSYFLARGQIEAYQEISTLKQKWFPKRYV